MKKGGAPKKANKDAEIKARRAEERKQEREQKRQLRDYRRRMLRGKQKTTSIYFLLWSIFTAVALIVVLFFGFAQQLMMTHAFKSEAANGVRDKGRAIATQIRMDGLPDRYKDNPSDFFLFLASEYDVRVCMLNESGEVILPKEPYWENLPDDGAEGLALTKTFATLIEKIAEENGRAVVFQGMGEYVYGSKIVLSGVEGYLYVGQSLELMQTALARMNVWTVLTAVFVFVLTFTVSAAVSGWLTKPLSEMTEKAHRLAQGDFNVDFHGADYGREMVELADTLNFARDELSKTDRMQKELIANVSHDFKTPLTMIKAYASMIIEISGENPEKRNKHAQVIVDEADRLASLVNDVLDLSKIRSGIETLTLQEFDLSACVHEILDRFAYLKETQGYKLVADVEEGLYTRADEIKIGQVLYNLIGNAVNYTGEDRTVYVRLKKEQDGALRFSVTDTGKGIKSEEIGEIWDRYYRSSETHKRPVQGTGLGLSIVKTILERHGLQFGVDSEVGKGSTFYVLFLSADEGRVSENA